MCNIKKVIAPLTIDMMNLNLESKDIYVFDLYNSAIKGKEFIEYIKNVGIISDVITDNCSYEDKELVLLQYMTSNGFFFIKNLNTTILNCLNIFRGKEPILKENIFNPNELEIFTKTHNELFNNWRIWLDSYIVYTITYVLHGKDKIKEQYNETPIYEGTYVGKNIVSMILDDNFYDIYVKSHPIDHSQIFYLKDYIETYTYDNKPFDLIMLNDANYFGKILHTMKSNELFKDFLKKI